MERRFVLCIFSVITALNLGLTSGACYSRESCLYEFLMQDYSSQVRPATGPTGTVSVSIELDLLNILGIDEKNEVLESVFSIEASWKDHFLSWNSSEYEIPVIVVNVKNLWLPDFAITNSVESFYKTTFLQDFRAHIVNTGEVIWKFGGVFKTSCSLDIQYYPFDKQSCTIKIENWAYRENLVNLTEAVLITSNLEENSLWDLTNSSVERDSFAEDSLDYPRIIFNLDFKRKTNYYIFNIILPCVLVMLAAMGVFWLPADCGEKISLGITVLLAFSVFQIVIMENTPVNSEKTPFISQLVMTIMAMATLSVLSAMITIYLHFKGSITRVPKVIRIVAFKGLAKILFLKDDVNAIDIEVVDNIVEPMEPAIQEKPIEMKPKPETELGLILKQLMIITDTLKEDKADEAISDEWKLLAKIIDRMFFWISACILIIVIIVISPLV